jgi:hypothetical protein
MVASPTQRHGTPLASARGSVYTTHHDRPVTGRAWCFWYLQTSKKVWFPVERRAVEQLEPVFTYDGRPILHHSERSSSWTRALPPYAGRPAVSWGHFLGTGFRPGPAGTGLYLQLWTRWTWVHPEACGRPDRFGVDFFRRPGAGETG